MIDLTVYSSAIDDLVRGETTAVCHKDCPAGEDTRYRLYLTKPASSPNVVLGYCHNCNESGVLRDTNDTPYRDFGSMLAPPRTSKRITFDIPPNMVACGDRWPSAAHAWRIKKKMTKRVCCEAKIQYDPASHRVYLPTWQYIDPLPRNLIGYQLRQLDGAAPKYLTAQEEQDTILYTVMRPYPERCKHYILVEDLASGFAITEAIYSAPIDSSHLGVLVNYGVKTKVEALNDCPDMHMGLVWLDNDGDHILDQSHSIAKTWHLVSGVDVRQNITDCDPKLYQPGMILKTITGAGL